MPTRSRTRSAPLCGSDADIGLVPIIVQEQGMDKLRSLLTYTKEVNVVVVAYPFLNYCYCYF